MGAYKDFDAARTAGEPLTFKLGGVEFTTTGEIPFFAIVEVSAAKNPDDTWLAIGRFFEALIPADQADEFAHVLRRVPREKIEELIAWVSEEMTGRPLDSAPASQNGEQTTGPPSRVVSLSALPEAQAG